MKNKNINILLSATLLSLFFYSQAYAFFSIKAENNTAEQKMSFVVENGTVYSDNLVITNEDKKNPLKLSIKFVDGQNTEQGDISYKTTKDTQLGIGKWFALEQTNIEVLPLETKKIPFKIDLSQDTNITAGTYYGGIEIIKAPKVAPEEEVASGFQGKVVSRSVDKVLLTIPGTISTSYNLKNFSFKKTGNNNVFYYELDNKGNTQFKIEGKIAIEGTGMNNPTILEIPSVYIDRETSRKGQINWPNPPELGTYKATLYLDVSYYDSSRYSFIDLGKKVQTINFTLIPVEKVSIILLILLLIITAVIYRKVLFAKALRNTTKYSVQNGEDLTQIAKKYNTSWKFLAKLNKFKPPYTLKEKQQILVPKLNAKNSKKSSNSPGT